MKSYLLNFFLNLFLKNLLLHNMHCYNKKILIIISMRMEIVIVLPIFKLQIQNILFKDRHSEEIHPYRDHFSTRNLFHAYYWIVF